MKTINLFLLSCAIPLLTFAYPPGNAKERSEKHKEMLKHFSKDSRERKYAGGSLWGARTKLAQKGISVSSDYYQYVLGDPVGQSRRVTHSEAVTWDLNWDFEKCSNVKGLEFHVGALIVSGKYLESKIGSALPLTLLYSGRTFLVNNLYLKQRGLDDRLVIKLGRLMSGDDFLTSPLRHKFLTLTIGSQVGLYYNTPASGYPYATWGAFASLSPVDYLNLQVGVYSADKSAYQNKHHGLDLSFNAKGGAEVIAETALKFNQKPHQTRLPGTYKLGVFYFLGTQHRYFSGDRSGNYGTYLSIDQKLFHQGLDRSRGLSSFLTVLFFPKDRNLFSFYTTAGLVWNGVFASRPKDALSLGMGRACYSSDLRRLQQISADTGVPSQHGDKPQDFEMLYELNYWFQVNPWFRLTPAAQYVVRPSGTKGTNALVLSLQSIISF